MIKFIHNKSMLTTIGFLLLFVHASAGQTLDDYLQMAGENNPGLRASFLQYHAALERVPQAGALPDPEVSFGIFLKPMERYTGNQIADISIMQMLPWFGTLKAARNEATQMAYAKYEIFRERRAMLRYDVKVSWWKLHLINKEMEVVNEQVKILETIEQVANNKILTGNGSMSDILRLNMERNELSVKIEDLKDLKNATKVEFNQLLNREPDAPIELTDNLKIHISQEELAFSLDSILTDNPELQMYQREQSAYSAMETMNRRMGLPMVGIGLNYGIFEPRQGNQSMMNGDNMLMPMVSVSIPIWGGKYRAAIREAEIRQQSALEQQLNTHNNLVSEFESTRVEYSEALRRASLFEEQINLASQVLDILITDYLAGNARFEEIMRIQQKMTEYDLNKARAYYDSQLAIAKIDRMIGN
ncbi:TolC family protein [Alkalitalea saponilacus]|uniref:Outer membrane protein TolC n=1 Tax=Alkalitalea saponilacus TaxID=889453 RepID=A0A1T5CM08_9BACT|nr:TolC family protein [Alkalitalea saponilacus]ASB49915.1 hypothetical protein CDL62_12590 [Alkalitalea saponilacus]SKB60522.1 Outer membrane protein TolC [Alkalitalea saponilacus]